MTKKDKKQFSYEKGLEELEEIRLMLEENKIPIDDLIEKVKRAKELYQECFEKLRSVEVVIEKETDDV